MPVSFCPLCGENQIKEYSKDFLRLYHQCLSCHLIFVSRDELITLDEEKKRYDAHENNLEDQGYRFYLENIFSIIQSHLSPGDRGLDFGCGHSKMIEDIAAQQNILIDSFDLFYHPNEKIWNEKYDFIILSEVIEHLRSPVEELQRIQPLLNENGKIFIKTKLLPKTKLEFDHWFYKRDKTHIQFFSREAFDKLSEKFQFESSVEIGEDLFLFKAK
jgi:hypothetical protein